jgi:hypothetical protein
MTTVRTFGEGHPGALANRFEVSEPMFSDRHDCDSNQIDNRICVRDEARYPFVRAANLSRVLSLRTSGLLDGGKSNHQVHQPCAPSLTIEKQGRITKERM